MKFDVAVLGTLTIKKDDRGVSLPASRKTRALLGYLLLSDRPQRREHLCDLFWSDGPDDPRGALRWSLSKLRGVIDDDVSHIVADREAVSIDRVDFSVDLRVARGLLTIEQPAERDLVGKRQLIPALS